MELYTLKRWRGPALTVAGSFIMIYSSVLYYIMVSKDPQFLTLTASSLGAVGFIMASVFTRNKWLDLCFLSGSGTIFAYVATALLVLFSGFGPVIYTLACMLGSAMLFKGIYIALLTQKIQWLEEQKATMR